MKYQFEVKPQGTRMDGEKIFGLSIINPGGRALGVVKWMWFTQYDELTQCEVDDLVAVMGAGK